MPINYTLANTDLVTLIERHAGISLTRKANHRDFGPEYWGFCPFCGTGDNRFHVWPQGNRKKGPHYWCRVCDAEGSPAKFLVEYCHMNYFDANNELGFDIDASTGQQEAHTTVQHDKDFPPSAKWQEAGIAIVTRAERYLWHKNSSEGQQALTYLRARGLSDETIKKARLGYIPPQKGGKWHVSPFEAWGIDPDQLREDQRQKGGVRIPDGIVMPWFESSALWKITIKRPGQDFGYGQVLGSSDALYNVSSVQVDEPVMLVESVLDALSVMQEAGDLINVVATDGAKHGHGSRWLGELSLASVVLQSFDDDEPGDKGAHYWLQSLSHAIRWAPWGYKDPNEMLQNKDELMQQDLRCWVETGLEAAQSVQTLPMPTLARVTEEVPVVRPDFQQAISAQGEYDRLSLSHRVQTPDGPGSIWDMSLLREQIERGSVRVILDKLRNESTGSTKLFAPADLEPVKQKVLAF